MLSYDRCWDGEIGWKRRSIGKSDVLIRHLRDSLALGNHRFSFDGEQEYVLVPLEHTTEQDPFAIAWPTMDVPQAPRTINFFSGDASSRARLEVLSAAVLLSNHDWDR